MPRKNYAIKPFVAILDYVNGKKRYVIVSSNGFTYHHEDKRWRYRRLNDIATYSYPSMAAAKRVANMLNKNIVESEMDF